MLLRRVPNSVEREARPPLARRVLKHWFVFLVACAVGTLIWTRLVEAPTESWGYVLKHWVYHLAPFYLVAAALLPFFVRETLKLSEENSSSTPLA